MSADSSDQDLKALWQDQGPETDLMTLERIQTVSRRLDRKRQRALIAGAAVAAFLAFNGGRLWQGTEDPLTRIGVALLALGGLGYLIVLYRLSHPARDPAEPAGLFLRRRLAEGLRPGRAWIGLAPLLPGLLVMIAVMARNLLRSQPAAGPAGLALQFLPLLIVAAAWLYAMWVAVPHARRRIRQQLRELDEMLGG